MLYIANHISVIHAWAQFGGGHRGRVPPLFQTGVHNMPCPPTFFSLGFVVGKVLKIKVMFTRFVEEVFKLDGRPHRAKLMLKLWYGITDYVGL